MKYLFKIIKPVIFGVLILFYMSALKGVFKAIGLLFQSKVPYKSFIFFFIFIYLIYLINLYLVPKIYFEKSVLNSIIWAAIFNMIFIILLAYVLYNAFNLNIYIIDLDLREVFNNLMLEAKFKGKLKENDYQEFKKVVSLSIYVISFLVIVNSIISIIIYKKYKSKIKY